MASTLRAQAVVETVNGGFTTIGSYGQDAARRACNATLSAAAVGGGVNETELSDRGRIVAHIEQRACRAVDTTTPAALGSSGVLVLLLSCCCCWCCCRRWSRKGRAKRARRRRARALEKESLRTAGDSAGTEL